LLTQIWWWHFFQTPGITQVKTMT